MVAIKFNKKAYMSNPQLQLIPASMWKDKNFFKGGFDTRLLNLMQASNNQLLNNFNELNCFRVGDDNTINAWLVIALSHPNLSYDALRNIARQLNLPEPTQFYLACSWGNLNFLKCLTNQYTKEKLDCLLNYEQALPLRKAVAHGHLPIIRYLVGKNPNILQLILRKGSYSAVLESAVEYGQLPIVEYLGEQATAELSAMIRAKDYTVFSKAAENGDLNVLKYLQQKLPDELQSMIKGGNYRAYYLAAVNGHIHVLEYLEKKVAKRNLDRMIKANIYSAFRGAAANNHLNVLQYLEKKLSQDELLKIIKTDDYAAFRLAAANGYLGILLYLEQKAQNELQAMIKAKSYAAFSKAADNGHLEVAQYLGKKLSPEQLRLIIQAFDYDVFLFTAENGHLEVLEYLEQLAPGDLLAMIRAKNDFVFQVAAGNGHLKLLQHIVQKVSAEELQRIIEAVGCVAFDWAAGGGHLNILHYLVEICSKETVQKMIRKDGYEAYKAAATGGHLAVLHYLEQQAPDEVSKMVVENKFQVLHTSPPNVANYLLRHNEVFHYAEGHDSECRHHIRPYIDNLIKNILKQKAQFKEKKPDSVFDVPKDQAKQYFYCLRNLIRRGQPVPREELLLLLGIPSVKALVHTPVTVNRPNELLRLALSNQNIEAAELLLALPAVRQLAVANGYYRSELQEGMDAGVLALDNESSLVALTPGEQKKLEKVQEFYKTKVDSQKVPALMYELRATLNARYNKNPAYIETQGKVIKLPLEWSDFQNLPLNGTERNLALEAYYQHNDHTALRYLSVPNFWMHEEADFINVNIEDHSERWSNFDEYEPLIALLYVAAKDENMPAIDGFTVATRLSHFINELAYLGRAHNWDKSRTKGNDIEEYDDLEGDRPSCLSGVKRRLFQSVLGHPLFLLLTADGIKQEVRNFALNHFKALINVQNCREIKAAWDKVCAAEPLTESQLAVLKGLDIPTEKQTMFIKQLVAKYGVQFSEDTQLKIQVEQSFILKYYETNHVSSSAFASTRWDLFLESRLTLLKFLELLRDLEVKQTQYLIYYPSSNEKAKKILAGIKEKANDFYQLLRPSEKSVKKFKEDCISILQKNATELQEHRSFLGALFAAINQFFVALKSLICMTPSRYGFFDSRTESAKIIHTLQEDIKNFPIRAMGVGGV